MKRITNFCVIFVLSFSSYLHVWGQVPPAKANLPIDKATLIRELEKIKAEKIQAASATGQPGHQIHKRSIVNHNGYEWERLSGDVQAGFPVADRIIGTPDKKDGKPKVEASVVPHGPRVMANDEAVLTHEDIKKVARESDLAQILKWLQAIASGREHDVTAALLVAKKKHKGHKKKAPAISESTFIFPTSTPSSGNTSENVPKKAEAERVEGETRRAKSEHHKHNHQSPHHHKHQHHKHHHGSNDSPAADDETESFESTLEKEISKTKRHEHDVHVEHHEEGVGQGGNRNLPKVVA